MGVVKTIGPIVEGSLPVWYAADILFVAVLISKLGRRYSRSLFSTDRLSCCWKISKVDFSEDLRGV